MFIFFWWVFVIGAKNFLCSKVVTLPYFHFLLEISVLWDYVMSLQNSHVTFSSEPPFPVVLLLFHQPHHRLVSLSLPSSIFSLLLYEDFLQTADFVAATATTITENT